MTVRAPIAGTVLQVNAKSGELAAPPSTQPLIVLGDVSALRVRAELDERDLGEIKVGQAVDRARGGVSRPRIRRQGVLHRPARRAGPHRRARTAQRSDVDVVEVVVDLAEPGPLAVGMKVDVFFRQDK